MAQTLAYHQVYHEVFLCVLFIVRSTAEDCPDVLANSSCKDTFILQTNGTVAFDCMTDHKSDGKWWKVNDNECTTFASLNVKPPGHKAILNNDFTLQLYNLTYEDNATYTCIVFGDIIASNCLLIRVVTDLSIEYNSKTVDEDSPITIFERDKLNLTCKTGPTYPAVNLTWILNNMPHPSKTVENENADSTANYSTTLVKQFTSVTSVNISCGYRPLSNSKLKTKSVVVNINVLPILFITVNGENVTGTFVPEIGKNYTTECVAFGGRPPVNLTWRKEWDTKITEHKRTIVSVNAFNSNWYDTKLSMEETPCIVEDTNITCFSFGTYPEQENSTTLRLIKIQAQSKQRMWQITVLFSILLTTLALLLLVILRVAYGHRTRKLDTDIFMSDWRSNETQGNFPIGTYGEDGLQSLSLMRTQSEGSDEEPIADVKRDEVSMMTTLPGRSYLQYFKGNFTKSGKSRYILVKTAKEEACVKDMYTFVKCCNLMQCLPRQESIVTLLGISVGEMPIYSYHEYVEGLTLRDYMLRNFQSSSLNATSTNSSHSIEKYESTCYKELYVFAENVANGMDFLVSHNFSHPALSTRKVLLNTKGRCKLYDIWPDVLVLERMRYLLNRESPPLAWMAPECTFMVQYHPQTDVWSYGILLWELFSFGETPYYTMSNSEIEQDLRNSRHLAIPPNCPGSIFSIMLSSWNKNCEQRPTFKEIWQKLSCLLRSLEQEEEAESVVSHETVPPNDEYFTLDTIYSEM